MKDDQQIIHQKRVSDGGSIMVWMMMMPNGLLSHRVIEGKFNSEKYIKILKECTVPIIKLNYGEDFYFQQDNSPIHTAKTINKFFESSSIKVIKWPSRSPDINVIEDVWKMVSDIVYDGLQYQTKGDLKESINNAIMDINKCSRYKVQNLYTTIRSRLCTVLEKNGCLFNKI